MLRRTPTFSKVSRNWTKKSLSATSHFPLKVVDPAQLRNEASTAKEQKVFYVTKEGDPLKESSIAARAMLGVKQWAQIVRLQQPTGLYLTMIPCFWGTAMACTRALVFEGADPVVLCAPLLPLHLVVLFSLGTFTVRAAGHIANDLMFKDKLQKELTEHEKALNPIMNGAMSTSNATAILAAHGTVATVIALNLSPAAISALCATLPLAVVLSLLQRVVLPPASSLPTTGKVQQQGSAVLAQALLTGLLFNMGIFVGYGAVVNRIDWWVCGPAYFAAVMWTCIYEVIHTYQHRNIVQAEAQSAANATPLSTNLNHANNPFGAQKTKGKCGVNAATSKSKSDATDMSSTLSLRSFADTKLGLSILQFPVACGFAMAGVLSPQAIFFYVGLAWSSYYLSSVVDHLNVYDRWSCNTAYKRNVKYGWMILFSFMAGNAFWAFASEYEPQKDQQSISEESVLKSAISFGNPISPRSYDTSNFTWMDRFLKPAFVQGQALGAKGVPPEDIVIPAWMRREHFGENCSKLARFLLGGVVSEATISGWERWWYSMVDHYNLLAKWAM